MTLIKTDGQGYQGVTIPPCHRCRHRAVPTESDETHRNTFHVRSEIHHPQILTASSPLVSWSLSFYRSASKSTPPLLVLGSQHYVQTSWEVVSKLWGNKYTLFTKLTDRTYRRGLDQLEYQSQILPSSSVAPGYFALPSIFSRVFPGPYFSAC
jgi:hypothetical protein